KILKAHPDYYRDGRGIVGPITRGGPSTEGGGTVAPAPQFITPPPRASSADLANEAIDAKRADIAARKQEVLRDMAGLQGNHPRYWMKSETAKLNSHLRSLEADDRAALQERHYNSMATAHQATVEHKQERDIQSANQHIGLIHGLEQISERYPIGTQEHAEAVLNLRANLAEQFPLGKLPKEGEDLLKAHAAV